MKNRAQKKTIRYRIGIDEAGRGPLAGPVAVGVVIVSADFDMNALKGIKDSKKLTESQREEWYSKLKNWKKQGRLSFHVSLVSASVIDAKGMSYAIRTAIERGLRILAAEPESCRILLDGSLKAPPHFKHQQTIIKGDEKIPLISLASIAAKVTRDRRMKRYASIHSLYGFEVHKGYGTLAHRKLIQKFGPSPIHRKSFLGNILKDSTSFHP